MSQQSNSPTSRKEPAPGLTREEYLEQYKAYLSDLGNIGTRYATVQGFYVSVISALLGLLALTESQKLFNRLPVPTLLIVCLFTIVLCIVWSLTIRFYKKLFWAKFTVLKQMEEYLPIDCFAIEYDLLTQRSDPAKRKEKDGRPGLLRVEHLVPLVLILFFVAFGVIRVIYR